MPDSHWFYVFNGDFPSLKLDGVWSSYFSISRDMRYAIIANSYQPFYEIGHITASFHNPQYGLIPIG